MDPVHDRGSMDPVYERGPWTSGPCFVLTHFQETTKIDAFYIFAQVI